MLSLIHRSVGIALRFVVAGLCCLGIWHSWKLARADYLFHQDTEDSVRAAIGLAPDGWEYYMRLAELDRPHARDLVATSLRLDHYNAQADIELGLQYEADGDYGRAERMLLDAYDVDHTYLPRWSLANFYLRRDNMPAFWAWVRSAAAMPSEDVAPLFQLCWRVTTDTNKITEELLNDKPDLVRQYLLFLIMQDQINALPVVASRLIAVGEPTADRGMTFWALNRLVETNDAPAANALWRALMERHWVVADSTVPNNPTFARDPLPIHFDWSLPEYPGLHSWPGYSGLEAEFSGSQPEDCTVADQTVTLTPGNYNLAYSYHTSQIAPNTGIKWQIIDSRSQAVLAESDDLSSEIVTESRVAFTVPPGASLVRLHLGYERALGTPHIAGMLVVLSTQVQPRP